MQLRMIDNATRQIWNKSAVPFMSKHISDFTKWIISCDNATLFFLSHVPCLLYDV